MASMEYCMFENTQAEMEQVVNALQEGIKLGDREMSAYRSLVELCEQFGECPDPIEDYEDDIYVECSDPDCEDDIYVECSDPDCEGC